MTIFEDTKTALAAKTVTHITGTPTIEQLDTLQEECAKIAASVKTTIIEEGMQYGHLVLAIGQDEYRTETGLSTYVHIDPVDPGGYCIKITNKTTDMERAKLEGEHKKKSKRFPSFSRCTRSPTRYYCRGCRIPTHRCS